MRPDVSSSSATRAQQSKSSSSAAVGRRKLGSITSSSDKIFLHKFHQVVELVQRAASFEAANRHSASDVGALQEVSVLAADCQQSRAQGMPHQLNNCFPLGETFDSLNGPLPKHVRPAEGQRPKAEAIRDLADALLEVVMKSRKSFRVLADSSGGVRPELW